MSKAIQWPDPMAEREIWVASLRAAMPKPRIKPFARWPARMWLCGLGATDLCSCVGYTPVEAYEGWRRCKAEAL